MGNLEKLVHNRTDSLDTFLRHRDKLVPEDISGTGEVVTLKGFIRRLFGLALEGGEVKYSRGICVTLSREVRLLCLKLINRLYPCLSTEGGLDLAVNMRWLEKADSGDTIRSARKYIDKRVRACIEAPNNPATSDMKGVVEAAIQRTQLSTDPHFGARMSRAQGGGTRFHELLHSGELGQGRHAVLMHDLLTILFREAAIEG